MNKHLLTLFCFFIFIFWPAQLLANFIWTPTLYFFSFTLWWVIPGGIFIEFAILKLFLRTGWIQTIQIVLLVNLVSAVVGFVVCYPIAFNKTIMDFVVKKIATATIENSVWSFRTVSVLFFLSTIIINFVVETFVAHWKYKIKYSKRTIVGFFAANLLSFMVVYYGINQIPIQMR